MYIDSSKVSSKSISPPSLLVLVFISMIGPLAMNIYLPSSVTIQTYFSTSYSTVQLGISLFLVASAVALIILGTLSDRFGRRPIMLGGLLIFCIGTVICLMAASIELFLLGRAIQGFGSSAGISVTRAVLRDQYDRDKSASLIGYVTMGMAVAPMVGPYFAGHLAELFGWQSSFWILLGLGILLYLVSLFKLGETNLNPTSSLKIKPLWQNYRTLFEHKRFWLFCGIATSTSAMFFSFLGGASFISEHVLWLTPKQYGAYFILVALGYSIGNYLSGKWSAEFGIYRMIMVGNLCAVCSVFLLIICFWLYPMSPLSLYGPMFFLGACNGMVLPSTMAGIISLRPNLAGSASGLSGSVQIAVGALMSYITAYVLPLFMPASPWFLIMIMGAAISLATFFGFWVKIVARQRGDAQAFN